MAGHRHHHGTTFDDALRLAGADKAGLTGNRRRELASQTARHFHIDLLGRGVVRSGVGLDIGVRDKGVAL